MTSQPGKQTIATQILPNTSRSKGNLTMNVGQLIWYNIRKISLEKLYTSLVENSIPVPFLKSQNWAYLLTSSLKFHTVCFYCMSSWGLSKYIETKLQTTCFHFI